MIFRMFGSVVCVKSGGKHPLLLLPGKVLGVSADVGEADQSFNCKVM